MSHTSRSTAPDDTPDKPSPEDVKAAIEAAKQRLQAQAKNKRRASSQLTLDLGEPDDA